MRDDYLLVRIRPMVEDPASGKEIDRVLLAGRYERFKSVTKAESVYILKILSQDVIDKLMCDRIRVKLIAWGEVRSLLRRRPYFVSRRNKTQATKKLEDSRELKQHRLVVRGGRGVMITELEKNEIRACASKYGAHLVVLFGSSVDRDDGHDIDLAVDGVEPGVFFEFYGDLIRRLARPVDLVDLTMESAFARLVLETGVKLYGAA